MRGIMRRNVGYVYIYICIFIDNKKRMPLAVYKRPTKPRSADYLKYKGDTVDSAFSGHCVKRTTVLSGQIFWSRQNVPLF